MQQKTVKCVLFDAVGTLIYATPDVVTAYHEIGAEHGSRLNRDEVSEAFRKSFSESENHERSSPDRLITSETAEKDRWRRVVSEVFHDLDSTDACFESLFEYFGRPSSWDCYEDVSQCLETMRDREIEIAIASNFDGRLHSVCDGLAPLKDIPHRIVSSEVGFRKPSRSFYDAALAAVGYNASEVLMIGDGLENDARGASEAGLKSAWLSRGNVSAPAGIATIGSLLEVETLLA